MEYMDTAKAITMPGQQEEKLHTRKIQAIMEDL